MKPSKSPRNGRHRPYQRSGFYAAKRAVVKYGPRVLPGPDTAVGRELREWRRALMEDLGGVETLSTQQLALIDETVVQRYLVASLNGYVLSLPALVNKRSRCQFPIVRERAAQVNLLRDLLRDLGLERRAAPMPDLREYIAQQAQAECEKKEPLGKKVEKASNTPFSRLFHLFTPGAPGASVSGSNDGTEACPPCG